MDEYKFKRAKELLAEARISYSILEDFIDRGVSDEQIKSAALQAINKRLKSQRL